MATSSSLPPKTNRSSATSRTAPNAPRSRPSSSDRTTLQVDVAPIIGGKRVETGDLKKITKPHDHAHVLGQFHQAGADQVSAAIAAAREAKPAWAAMPWEERAAIFLRAAALLAGPHRARLNGATMHGQSKTAHQAEIDSACELIDFLNFNVHFMSQIMAEQPTSGPGLWNRVESRPLDGFVFAITPFNFTAIAGNLPTAPAMCGNTVVWKPASTAVLSAHYLMELFEEAGLPPGVINLVPGSGSKVGTPVIESSELGGVHFTGSTSVFQGIWNQIGSNIERYAQYPRIVGETGGKDFVVVHESADVDAVVTGLLRGAFEFQGQKCSAASRAYVPKGLWAEIKQKLGAELPKVTMGSVSDFRNFMGALIDKGAYDKVSGAIAQAKKDVGKGVVEILGGECDDSKGYFIRPTVIVVDDPKYITMQEELFGPALTIFVYDDNKFSRDAAAVRSDQPVRADRGDLRQRARRGHRSHQHVAVRGRQLLRQRQADRRRRRPAAVRRVASLGHQRQGRLAVEPRPLDQPADDQRELQSAPRTGATRSWARSSQPPGTVLGTPPGTASGRPPAGCLRRFGVEPDNALDPTPLGEGLVGLDMVDERELFDRDHRRLRLTERGERRRTVELDRPDPHGLDVG